MATPSVASKFRPWACLLIVALSLPAAAAPEPAKRAAATMPARIILLRHAEKARGKAKDPPLTDAGAARAQALTDALEGVPLDAIYATQYRRTLDTAAPIADHLGISPTVLEADRMAQLVRRLKRDHQGQTILVVGHSFTLPQLLRRLGAGASLRNVKPQYGDLFVLTFDGGRSPTAERQHFGD